MKGLVSVVIPIYNVEKYLERCLESIRLQTYRQLEVLLVNDGTLDGSRRIAERYTRTDSRFVLYDKENGGLSSARNYGIRKARGVYITFVDSDDYVDENYVAHMLAAMEKYGADVVAVESQKFWGNRAAARENVQKVKRFSNIEAIADMWYQKHIENFACGKLYRTEMFHEICYPTGTFYEDLGTTYKLFYQAECVVWSSAKLYFYFQREESIMNSQFSIRKLDRLSVSRELLIWAREHCPELEDAAVARLFISNIQVLREMPLGGEYMEYWQEVWGDIKKYRCQVIGNGEAKLINRLIALSTYGGTKWLKLLGKIYKRLEH